MSEVAAQLGRERDGPATEAQNPLSAVDASAGEPEPAAEVQSQLGRAVRAGLNRRCLSGEKSTGGGPVGVGVFIPTRAVSVGVVAVWVGGI